MMASALTREDKLTVLDSPESLASAYTKSGEFDRLVQDLLVRFKAHTNFDNFMEAIDDLVIRVMSEDEKLTLLPTEILQQELMGIMAGYPITERAIDGFLLQEKAQGFDLDQRIRASLDKLLDSSSLAISQGSTSGDHYDEVAINMPQNERPKSPAKPLANGRKDH